MTELSRRQMLRMSPQARGAMLERQAGELGDYYGKERMSETTTTYDTGEVQVSVGGGRRVAPKAVESLEIAWAIEAGQAAWGEMTATFEKGELVLLRTNKTAKP